MEKTDLKPCMCGCGRLLLVWMGSCAGLHRCGMEKPGTGYGLRTTEIILGGTTMKNTLLYVITKIALKVLHIFGACAFLLTILALCGVRIDFFIGFCSVLPGWGIIELLTQICGNEIRKRMKAEAEAYYAMMNDVAEEGDERRE